MNKFIIKKKSGTYAELLETYGLSNIISKIFDKANINSDLTIFEQNSCYIITSEVDITDDILQRLDYFSIFKYIKPAIDYDLGGIDDYYDYPTQKIWKKEKSDLIQKIHKDYSGKNRINEKKQKIEEVELLYKNQNRLDIEYDVYAQISSNNNFKSFEKLFKNFYENKDIFYEILKEILLYYYFDEEKYDSKKFDTLLKNKKKNFCLNVTATQLYNPNQGQGLNKSKANGLNRYNFNSIWISELMKISGALSDMICQLVKVGSGYDLKIFVPEYHQLNYGFKKNLIPDVKRYLKGNTPIKIDILNILLLIQTVLLNSGYKGRKRRVNDIVSGLHSVYQKDLGQNKAVVNIGFLQVPNFIEIGNKQENDEWIHILKEQQSIIAGLDEDKGAVQGLMKYRNFISGSDINSFFDFSFWYASYLSFMLSQNKYVKAFSIDSLTKFYTNMDKNLKLMEIINNNGFQAVSTAIRRSTVSLQYAPKDTRKYEVRYGVAQLLQTKSKSAEDLAEFIGEFISFYNAETVRYAEKSGQMLRSNVRIDELNAFYSLLDNYSSRLVGALLASYGFALQAKEINNDENEIEKFDI